MSEVFRKKNHAIGGKIKPLNRGDVVVESEGGYEMNPEHFDVTDSASEYFEELKDKLEDDEIKKISPYHRKLKLTREDTARGFAVLDCNDILDLVGGNRSRLQHAAKKVLYAGARGHKDLQKDIEEAIWSLQNELFKIKSEANEG